MKRTILMMLLTISVSAVASDWQNRVVTLLNQNETATELDWRNKNLGNRDFEGLGIVSHVKKLDLSDNDFANDFPLTACLRVFPNLETLSINNNSRITGLSIDKDYKNTTLKVLNVENSGCTTIPVYSFYKNFELETLDVSESKQLAGFGYGLCDSNLRKSRKPLYVHVRNVVIEEKQLYTHNLETTAANNIKFGTSILVTLPASFLLSFCALWCPNYCMVSPLPPYHYDYMSTRDYVTYAAYQLIVCGTSAKLGYSVGGAIARRVLPDGGKVTAVKYITSSVDEAV